MPVGVIDRRPYPAMSAFLLAASGVILVVLAFVLTIIENPW